MGEEDAMFRFWHVEVLIEREFSSVQEEGVIVEGKKGKVSSK